MSPRVYSRRRRQPTLQSLANPHLSPSLLPAAVSLLLLLAFVSVLCANDPATSRPFAAVAAAGEEGEGKGEGGGSTLVVTVANWMYREHLANFACNLNNIGVHALVVYALDRRTAEFAAALGLASVLLSEDRGDDVRPGNFQPTGARSFSAITKRKLEAVRAALRSGFHVLLSDADIFWCRDAVVVLEAMVAGEAYNDSDVVIQAEVGYRTLNSGFYYVRAGERSMHLFDKLIANIHLGAHDQDVVNKVFCDKQYGGNKIQEPTGPVPFRCESHGATIRVLPSQTFPSGAEPFDGEVIFKKSRVQLSRMCQQNLVVVHNNFIRANKKKARFIQKGMWYTEFYGEKPVCHSTPVPENPSAARTCGIYC